MIAKLRLFPLDTQAHPHPMKKSSGRTPARLRSKLKDPFAIERLDDREDYGELRYIIIGMAEGDILLYVAYTERENRIRIISARRVTQHEQEDYFRQNA